MPKQENTMILVDTGFEYMTLAHKGTGVMYLVVREGLSPRAVCVMVDAEGKPLIYKGDDR